MPPRVHINYDISVTRCICELVQVLLCIAHLHDVCVCVLSLHTLVEQGQQKYSYPYGR